MWQIINQTPYASAQSWVRDRDGRETWLVIAKATFDVTSDGQTFLSAKQAEVVRSPVYRSDPADKSSLIYENDCVLGKQATDIVVNGHVVAPNGTPVRSLDVAMQVGSVRKILKVFGNRVWRAGGGGLSVPEPFTKMPLTYERAFGGVDQGSENPGRDWYWPNPVGVGFVASASRVTHLRAPNIEYPDQLITSWESRPAPAGFGVLASHWQERAKLSGTYDKAWEDKRQPLLPLDFDIRHYQSVPKDQQAPGFLVGGERCAVTNMTASGAMRFTLPVIKLLLETRFQDGRKVNNPAPRLHTVIVEPDHSRVSLVWHSAMECHSKVSQLESTRIRLDLPKGHKDEIVSRNLLDLL
jgi:hypothetical protein